MVHARHGHHPGHHAARYPLPLNTPITATFPPESCHSSPSPSQSAKLHPLRDSPEPSPTDHSFYTNQIDLSARPHPQPARQADPGHSRRRPVPSSPLHRSFSPRQFSFSPFASGQNFYTHDEEDDDDGQQLSRNPRTADSFPDLANPDSPRSPHDVLDGLLAAGPEPFPRDDSPNIEAHQLPPTGPRRQSSLPDKSPAAYHSSRPYSYAQLRFLPGALHASRLSPPATPTTMMPAAKPANLPDFRSTMPRNTSIDSAVSSISSNASQPNPRAAVSSLSYRPPQDAAAAQQPDFAALIQAAGSAEAALYNMWKEKQSLENHNQQLWRIVTKQKDMVVGLNKDLERALKDRERYRKKLKENLSQATPLPSTAAKIDALNRETSSSPALSEPQDTAPSSRKSSGNDVVPSSVRPLDRKLSEEQTPTVQQSQVGRSQSIPSQWPAGSNNGPAPVEPNTVPANVGPSPLNNQAGQNVPALETPDRTPGPTAPQALPKLRHLQLREEAAGSQGLDDAVSPKTSVPDGSLQTRNKAPALSFTSATPSVSSTEFSSPTEERPHRKAPPAPLNLAQTQRPSDLQDEDEESDSDYEEVLNVDPEEMGVFTRGRKKTREDDDLQREYLAKKEAEARSQSNKSKSKSKSKSQSKGADGIPSPKPLAPGGTGLPSSPRLAQAPGSINALLSPAQSDGSASQRVVSPPLMSPGLPVSPRPGDRPPGAPHPRQPKSDYFSSPQMSPRGANGLPLSPRPPRDGHPVVLPPQPLASPHHPRVEQPSQPHQEQASNANEHDRQNPPSSSISNSESDKRGSSGSESEQPAAPDGISRELVSDQYPNLLLPPNALPLIQVKVFSSRLRPSRLSVMAAGLIDEDPVFLLSIHSRSSGKRLWRVEKTLNSLPVLDSQIKKLCEFPGQLPDRSLFSGHAPSKMDARRAALNGYFDKLLDTPMGERAALVICEFFSNDAFGAEEETPKPSALSSPRRLSQSPEKVTKEGYLTKKGKNFGGWKARYFVLESTDFRYYESPGGPLLGSIKIQYSQIGRQTPRNKANAQDEDMRHAFLILEPKKKDPSTKVSHILCAESDDERDSWIEALLRYVDPNPRPPEPPKPAAPPPSATESEHSQTAEPVEDAVQESEFEVSQARGKQSPTPLIEKRAVESPTPAVGKREPAPAVQGASYEDMVAAEAPTRGPGLSEMPSPQLNPVAHDHRMISAPTNGMKIENAELWGNKAMPAQTPIKDKKRSIFGFATYRARASTDLAPPIHHNSPMPQRETPSSVRPVWGIPLSEAVQYTQPAGVDILLPAVVYRCLEYLKAKNAHREEGIFRLSGSNLVIRALRDRFNTEGDIKLLEGEYYDVHAVASLLKSYLRDLPTSILTRELHVEFLRVLDLNERQQKIDTFNVLVHKLPPCNYDILRALSLFLIDIINNAHINKMNIRNVGIVFSPTLNIPGPLISFFINDYDQIFGAPRDDTRPVAREITVPSSNMPDAVRSPRLRTFSDTAAMTPSQTSFPPPQKQTPQGQGLGRLTMSHNYDSQAPREDGPLSADAATGPTPFSLRNSTMNSAGGARDAKTRRRESSMLLMGLSGAPKKNSRQRLREDTPVVAEEGAYE
ncbi:Rho GAP domain-containing protein [Phyllosticta capitalensis]